MKGSKVRPFSKKAEVLTDPYQALIQQISDMRSRMEQVQQRLESSPLPKQAGKDETDPSELSIEEVFEDVAMGLDLLESKLKDEPESEELHKSLEELENLLWETEQKAGIKPEISEEEKAEPEHKEIVKEVVKEVLKEIEEKKEEKPVEKEEKEPVEKEEKEIIEINAAAVPNPALGQPIVPAPAPVKNVQPTDDNNLNVTVVKPTSPPPPGMVWVFDTEGNKFVTMPDPANPQKTI
jgi:DNA-directed RNA polymerase beta' subunit